MLDYYVFSRIMRKNKELEDIISPAVEGLGFEFVGVEYHPNAVNALLRIFIDKDGGVNLDDCVAVNTQVSGVLDVNDPLPGKYTLEISSPGLNRPLFSLTDFKKFTGSLVKLRLNMPIDRQRNFKGVIASVNDEVITLNLDDNRTVEFSFGQIELARLVPVFD